MKCFVCDQGQLAAKFTPVDGMIKGETYTVKMEALVCEACGHVALEGSHSQEYMRLLADAYRRQHKYLTSEEIRAIRGPLSQRRFASQIGVGVASVKRWELGLIQDWKSDRLIREFAIRGKRRWSYEVEIAVSKRTLSREVRLDTRANSPPDLHHWHFGKLVLNLTRHPFE